MVAVSGKKCDHLSAEEGGFTTSILLDRTGRSQYQRRQANKRPNVSRSNQFAIYDVTA